MCAALAEELAALQGDVEAFATAADEARAEDMAERAAAVADRIQVPLARSLARSVRIQSSPPLLSVERRTITSGLYFFPGWSM